MPRPRPCSDSYMLSAHQRKNKLKPASFELSHDLPVPEPCKTAHLRCDHNRVIVALARGGQLWNSLALSPRLNQLASDVARDVQRLGHRPPPLRDETGSSSDVARNKPSGNCSTSMRIATSIALIGATRAVYDQERLKRRFPASISYNGSSRQMLRKLQANAVSGRAD